MPNEFDRLHDFFSQIANEVNSGHRLREPDDPVLNRPDLASLPKLRPHFQEIGEGIFVPRATEALRMLSQVRQRFSADEDPRELVERVRLDVIKRVRPERNRTKPLPKPRPARPGDLTGEELEIANFSPKRFEAFSSYQVEGWGKVSAALRQSSGLVITAPTGAGKTEVFMLPLFHHITTTSNQGHYFLIYPRTELLKDQLSRALLFSWQAGQLGHRIPIGLQFGGVGKHDVRTIERGLLFDNQGTFVPVPECPVCEQAALSTDTQEILREAEAPASRGIPRPPRSRARTLTCQNPACGAQFSVTISREGHVEEQTRILLVTAESLERFYLLPSMQDYLKNLAGIIIDEAHLYEGLYGVHVHQLLQRVEQLTQDRPLSKIAASATIGDPQVFASKLFYGGQRRQVDIHHFKEAQYPHETDGLEVFITLQVPPDERTSAPLLIQSVMALGHGVLEGELARGENNQLQVTFIDSLDSSERITEQVNDAENNKLWAFRTLLPNQLKFKGIPCPGTQPTECCIYAKGECWRGLIAGKDCTSPTPELRTYPLRTELISSQAPGKLAVADAAIATPALEVGVDDKRIRAVLQYGAPRSVASLTQRRGRAGRAGRDVSYTIMVLGDGASDHYALANRHFLQRGRSDLPLNIENPVIRELHDRLREERQRYAATETPWFEPIGTVKWIHNLLSLCPRIQDNHQTFLDGLQNYIERFKDKDDRETLPDLRKFIMEWADTNLARVRPILEIRRHLQVLSEAFPDELQAEVKDARQLGEQVLQGEGQFDGFMQKLRDISGWVSQFAFDVGDEHYQELALQIIRLGNAFREHQGKSDYAEYQRAFSFFSRLKEWLSRDQKYFLWSPPDDIKAILQALFYYHHDVRAGHVCCDESCEARVPFLIPENFFSTLRPLLFERRDGDGNVIDQKQESIDKLNQIFYPYRLAYRYDPGGGLLTTLDTEHHRLWVTENEDGLSVDLELPAIGLDTGGYLVPQQIPVKSVRTDRRGRQVVGLCRGCFRIHDLGSKRSCCKGHDLILVNLYSTPVLKTNFEPTVGECRPISTHMCTATGVGTTQIQGSDVEATLYEEKRRGRYSPKKINGENETFGFKARYLKPLQYGVAGRAVGWNIDAIARALSEDLELQARLGLEDAEQAYVQALDTATSMLHRAVAGVSGVRLDSFQSTFDQTTGKAWVWEVYEGGAGLTELFALTLRRDPLIVFEEMLKAALCPIGTAEEANKTGKSLKSIFEREWQRYGLPERNAAFSQLYADAEAELQRMQEMQKHHEQRRDTCTAKDGCPSCLHGGVHRAEDERLPSRTLAGYILEGCLVDLDPSELIAQMTQFPLLGPMPRLLGQTGGKNRVLRF